MKNYRHVFSLLLILSIVSCNTAEHAEIYKQYLENPQTSRLTDFSYAGYHYGTQKIPQLNESVFNVNDHQIFANTEKDLTTSVQDLIDSIGKSGGGVIFFPAGRYLFNMDTLKIQFLRIDYNNIVLRGAGSDKDGTIFFSGSNTLQEEESPWISPFLIRTGYKLQGTKKMWGLNSKNDLNIRMQSGSKADPGSDGSIYEAPVYANIRNEIIRGERVIELDRESDFKKGDIILIGMYNTSPEGNLLKELLYPLDSFESYMKSALMAGQKGAASYQFTAEIESVIAPNKIQIAQPFRRNLPQKYAPVIAKAPMLKEIGIENIRFESAWNGHYCHHGCQNSSTREAKLMDYGWNAINMARVAHGWIQNVSVYNFTNPIYVQDSRNLTIDQINIGGFNGHSGIKLYGHSNDNLIQNIEFMNHYTHLLGGEGNGYGNVFRKIISSFDGSEASNFDFHGFSDQVFSPMGWNLFENIKGLAQIKGAGASFNLPNAANGNTFWNIEATGVDSLREVIQFYKYFDSTGKQIRNDHYRNYPGTILVGYHSIEGVTLLVEGKSEDRDDAWIYLESFNKGKILPESLYEAQLNQRLSTP